ncbi:MAG: hypothetical protein J6W18_01670 [Bacteroidaceae bacterium]|nr:hypothetical protein [Bacteroidaceae bacterium]
MKQMTQTIKYTLIAMMLVSTSYAAGQNLSDSDYPFVYGYDEPYTNYSPKPSDIYPIQLYPVLDEITLRKKPEMLEADFETLVKNYLPDAIFDWKTYQDDVCMVKAGIDIPDDVIECMLKEDAITFLYRNYIRKIYKDLMDIYPVKEIAVYGFRGGISFRYNPYKPETFEKVDSVIESKGLEMLYKDYPFGYARVPKDIDIITVANELHESGYFLLVHPIDGPVKTKTLNTQPIDKSTLPFFHVKNGKFYLYELYDRFMVRKSPSVSKSELESVIKGHLEESEIIWENDSLCTVLTIPEQVEGAMDAILKEDGVLRVSHEYFSVEDYEACLKKGISKPEAFGLTGVIKLSYKDDITEADKAKIISDYNLKLVRQDTVLRYWHYEVPKAFDLMDVCDSIFETGLVNYSNPATSFRVGIHWNNTGSTTKVKETPSDKKEIATQYYNLSGQRINAPSGLTIVVTRYSDGSVHTEKRLF